MRKLGNGLLRNHLVSGVAFLGCGGGGEESQELQIWADG